MTCRDAQIFQCNMIHEGYLYKCAVPPFSLTNLARLGKTDTNLARTASPSMALEILSEDSLTS